MVMKRAERGRLSVDQDEGPVDAYFRLRREATMLRSRAAELLARIDRDALYLGAGYPSLAAFLSDRLGQSVGEPETAA